MVLIGLDWIGKTGSCFCFVHPAGAAIRIRNQETTTYTSTSLAAAAVAVAVVDAAVDAANYLLLMKRKIDKRRE